MNFLAQNIDTVIPQRSDRQRVDVLIQVQAWGGHSYEGDSRRASFSWLAAMSSSPSFRLS